MEKSQPPSPSDLATARQTVDFLGRQLRMAQYAYRAKVKERRVAQVAEKRARSAIDKISNRIKREIDTYPTLFKDASRPTSSDD